MLKRILFVVLVVALGGLGLIAYSFRAQTLDVMPYARESRVTMPEGGVVSPGRPEVSMSLIKCGKMMSREVFIYRGGRWSATYETGMAAVLVRHPDGDILFDAGFGRNIDEHFSTIPFLMRALTTYEAETPAADQLRAHGIEPESIKAAIISHSHWDHVSGLEDFPGIEVWFAREEVEHIGTVSEGELVRRMRDNLRIRPFEIAGGRYETFERSFDFFGDGSVVLVPLPGHTPGSIGMFVNLKSGRRYFFVGDLTWSAEGLRIPAERPWIARKLADLDEEGVRRSIAKVHFLMKQYPDMVVVPAHDRVLHETLPVFPEMEK